MWHVCLTIVCQREFFLVGLHRNALRMVLNCDGEIKIGKTLRAYPSMTFYGTSKLRIEVYGNNYVMQEWRIC